jgi:hypothetical protein
MSYGRQRAGDPCFLQTIAIVFSWWKSVFFRNKVNIDFLDREELERVWGMIGILKERAQICVAKSSNE